MKSAQSCSCEPFVTQENHAAARETSGSSLQHLDDFSFAHAA